MTLPANRLFLIDASVWGRTKHPLVAANWAAALRNNQLAVLSKVLNFESRWIAAPGSL